ncbi:MAG: molybdopterin cofactor-binding domain-containing protein [Bacteroidota bacterium]
MSKKKLSRRKFIVRGGLGTLGVLAVGTYLGRNPLRRVLMESLEGTIIGYSGVGTEANLWFELTQDNKVLFHSPKVEMGQGTFTSFAQMIAEELDVRLDQVEVQAAATSTGVMDNLSTGGSLSVAQFWGPLRELAAMMREMLKLEAAKKMGVEASTLSTQDGMISGAQGSMTYAEVAQGVTEWEEPAETPTPRSGDFKYIGRPIPRVDLQDKVYGEPIYGLDAEVPNMLHAAIIRPSAVGATFKSADTQKAENMPGVVKVVQIDNWVGVIAQSYSEALAAKAAIRVEWDVPQEWTMEQLRDLLQVGKGDDMLLQKKGSALSEEDDQLEVMEFTSPIGAHAQIEPNGAVADYREGKLTITLSTQVIRITRDQVASALDMDADNVEVIPTQLGGGFGRRLNTNHAIQAAQLSMAVGQPVKYIFTRKEEFQSDFFRPPTHHVMKGKLNADGYLDSLEHHYASGDVAFNSLLAPPGVDPNLLNNMLGSDSGASRGGAVMYDGIPNRRSVQWHTTLPFATSWWRSLGLLANTFAIECFVDEMALKSGKDAVDFRLKGLGSDATAQRIRRVIEKAAEEGGYTEQVTNGRAMGFAASIDAGVPAAHVVEVSLVEGVITVHKVTCVMDCGVAVNPDQVKAQCEGSIIMGISSSVFEQMTLKKGELSPTIYGPYEMALMKHSPKEINVHLIQGVDTPLPVGEPPLGPIGAAIGNAVKRLTGHRITDIPMQPAYAKAMKQQGQDQITAVVDKGKKQLV